MSKHNASGSPHRDHWGQSRAQIVQGLRDAAEFLESHPELPTPDRVAISHLVVADRKAVGRAEVDRIATILDVHPHDTTDSQRYMATAYFGPVIYQALTHIGEDAAPDSEQENAIDVIGPEPWPI